MVVSILLRWTTMARAASSSASSARVTYFSATAAERLESLRRLQNFLDNAFRVPGTNFRFGWDPIIGLIPWIGDLITAMMSCAIVIQAHQMRMPRVVQLRMLFN